MLCFSGPIDDPPPLETVKFTLLLATPATVTTTFPLVAPAGTVATMLVALQLVAIAAVPLNVTVLVPCEAPKFAPTMVTAAPTAPDAGFKLVMLGVVTVVIVKSTPLLATPPTVTTTLPVVAPVGTGAEILVALHAVGVAAIPPNVTVLVPCEAPKFDPVIVTNAPTTPDVGFRLAMLGVDAVVTVKSTPLLATPPTVTTTLPVVAPVGTGTEILVALHAVGVAAIPPNITVLVPCEAPKFAPAIVTDVPTRPDGGFKLVMLGVVTVVIVKSTPLLATPPTVTTTLPVVAPVGTATAMLVALQAVGVAATPLNLTVLVPWEAPKFDPVIVTDAPTRPDVGFKLVMLGVVTVVIVKSTPLLATPPTVTTTLPVVAPVGTGAEILVALHAVGVAATPLNLTVLVPCEVPKFDPVIATDTPTTPDVGFRLAMLGADGVVTVKSAPLLATPPTVTTTLPVVAPVGTATVMLVALQAVGVAATPLNVTALVPCEAPKFAPAMITDTPTTPDGGFRFVMLAADMVVTVKGITLLATPPTVTTTLPVVAPEGTATVMLVALQAVGIAATPLNLTALVPCEAPKFDPVIVTDVPTTPDAGFRLPILGAETPPGDEFPWTIPEQPLLNRPVPITQKKRIAGTSRRPESRTEMRKSLTIPLDLPRQSCSSRRQCDALPVN
ncbi:MAG TPA: hypothetical protein VFN26_18915 [Candidatus Acidoferrum sp.]|nr:hypothetical protein [Candidatus Acidoferrum sp.]